ncbi:guanylate cyclase protein, partial [Trichomonas vaginalis G3]
MEEPATSTCMSGNFDGSMQSTIEKLIDIPVHQKIITNLVALFNYFDIYAPKMELLYKIVTVLRFFQLFGGALMASNTTVFLPGSLTYNTISIMSVFFHLIPCQYRNGIEYLALFALNTILFLFAIYLLIASSYYKKTSKVSKVTTYVLPVFMATGPFLFLPILAEFCGEILSGAISGNHPVKITEYIAVAESLVITVFYLWLLFQTFTTTLIFRSCSFKSLEGGPQNKLLL